MYGARLWPAVSLTHPEVSAQVQLILEGGKAAFQLRGEKYGF